MSAKAQDNGEKSVEFKGSVYEWNSEQPVYISGHSNAEVSTCLIISPVATIEVRVWIGRRCISHERRGVPQ